ncbi:MAG: SDR family NAD(P)-dependent oxidoreductase [Halioglobus sp.]
MSNNRALITGASSGIGREFAVQLASRGFGITAVARREDKLRELIDQLPGDQHDYLTADLSSETGVNSVIAAIELSRYQLLVNNAGFSAFEPFYHSELTLQKNILNVNCGAVVSLAHAFLEKSQDGDALINVASITAYLPTPAQPMYSASKAFIASLSECLWIEHKDRGVYVMGLCPGLTESEFIQTASGGKSDGQSLAALTQATPTMVGEALRALEKRKKSIIITGRINRLMGLMPRFMTRHRLIKVLAVIGDPDKAL